jgi:hypothetical protein
MERAVREFRLRDEPAIIAVIEAAPGITGRQRSGGRVARFVL